MILRCKTKKADGAIVDGCGWQGEAADTRGECMGHEPDVEHEPQGVTVYCLPDDVPCQPRRCPECFSRELREVRDSDGPARSTSTHQLAELIRLAHEGGPDSAAFSILADMVKRAQRTPAEDKASQVWAGPVANADDGVPMIRETLRVYGGAHAVHAFGLLLAERDALFTNGIEAIGKVAELQDQLRELLEASNRVARVS